MSPGMGEVSVWRKASLSRDWNIHAMPLFLKPDFRSLKHQARSVLEPRVGAELLGVGNDDNRVGRHETIVDHMILKPQVQPVEIDQLVAPTILHVDATATALNVHQALLQNILTTCAMRLIGDRFGIVKTTIEQLS